jgi:hypothetical protein
MRKTLIYLVLLAILGFGVYYFLFSKTDTFDSKEAGFNFADTAQIGKIYLADKSNNTVLLTRTPGGWRVNDKYPAQAYNISMLLNTLAKQEATYPVPEEAHNNVIKSLAARSIKVEVYNNEGENLGKFYVGGQAGKGGMEGSYMLMEGAERPYVVKIPGIQGYLTPRYSTDLKDWRDRMVVDLFPTEISSVTVSYPAEPLNSFTLQSTADGFVVKADSSIMKMAANTRRVKVYSKFFEKLAAEVLLDGEIGTATLLDTLDKRCIVDVTSKDGRKQHIEIYWMPLNRRSKNQMMTIENTPDGYDSDRMYATYNDFKDTAIIQRMSFERVMRKAYEFYQPDEKKPSNPLDTVFQKIDILKN